MDFLCQECGQGFEIIWKFNSPSLKTVLQNLVNLKETLPDRAEDFIKYLQSIQDLHIMCIEEKLPSDFRETLAKFKDCFNKLYNNFHLNMTLKIHVIFHHYEEYFETTGTNFRTTNGEHHEAVHHSLKVFERKKGFHQQKKLGTLLHQQKSLLSISCFNVLRAGFVPQNEFRLKKRKRTESESSSGSGPSSSPIKKSALKKSFVKRFLDIVE